MTIDAFVTQLNTDLLGYRVEVLRATVLETTYGFFNYLSILYKDQFTGKTDKASAALNTSGTDLSVEIYSMFLDHFKRMGELCIKSDRNILPLKDLCA